jgi:hypothetical protein
MSAAKNVTPVTDDAGWETVVEPFGETYSFETPGDVLIGKFLGSKIVQTEDLNKPGEMRDQTVYDVEDDSGKRWSVWSSYNIDVGLGSVAVGNLVRIEYVGKVDIDNGRRSVKQFKIAVKTP